MKYSNESGDSPMDVIA